MKRVAAFFLILVLLIICAANGETTKATDIITEMVTLYGNNGSAAEADVEKLLAKLEDADVDAAIRWQSIMNLWKRINTEWVVYQDVLPDGLPETDELCIVALGFQLYADGRMKPELVERLQVVLRCAEKYPNALILCTGGPTASNAPSITEAGKMGEWLRKRGIAKERLILEKESKTTAENAIYSCRILQEKYPQVKQLVIVSSDYHIATGTLLFEAEAILASEAAGQPMMQVVSNAAYKAPRGSLSMKFQASALIELAKKGP